VADRRATQFKQRITEVIATHDLVFFERLVAGYEEEHGAEPRTIAAALAYLAQKDRPLQPPADERERAPSVPAARKERGPAFARAERSPAHEERTPEPEPARRERPAQRANPELYAAREPKRPRAERGPDDAPPRGSVRYRIAVGHDHGVQPGNIVGAIANEAAIDSVHIGRIRIFDSYSTVELPDGMPEETFEQLQKAWVRGRQLAIRLDSDGDEPFEEAPRPPRRGVRFDNPRKPGKPKLDKRAKLSLPAKKKHRKGPPRPRG
jgi:ATP-dependent RNA helicase DeaD